MGVYLQHFGLKREPFSIVPDPNLLFPSYQHRQAVAHLKYGLDRADEIIANDSDYKYIVKKLQDIEL